MPPIQKLNIKSKAILINKKNVAQQRLQSNAPDVNYSKSMVFYCAVSFLAGFSFTKFVEKIDLISNTVYAGNDKDDTTNNDDE